MRQNKFAFLSCLVISLMTGCASYTQEVNARVELYIAADQANFDATFEMIKQQLDTNLKSRFVRTPNSDDTTQMFCTSEPEESRTLLQCMKLIPYYGNTYCDDITNALKIDFAKNNVELVILENSYQTCSKGENADSPKGGKTGFILGFAGDYKKKSTDWAAIANNIGRAFYKGNCYLPSDIAADGSRCGGRAATARPGGKN